MIEQQSSAANAAMVSAYQELVICKAQLLSTKETLDFSGKERVRLEAELDRLRRGYKYVEKHLGELTAHLSELEAMVVASQQLLQMRNRADACKAALDIVANVIGSEEMALFVVDEEQKVLNLVAACGVDDKVLSVAKLGEGTLGKVASTGMSCFGPAPHDATGITACVPVQHDAKIVGVLAIFGLLPQKKRLVRADHMVLSLLGANLGSYLLQA